MWNYIFVLDWLIHKPIKLYTNNSQETFKYWDKILYTLENKEEYFVGTYIWHDCDSYVEWNLIWKLDKKQSKEFNNLNQKALENFKVFKKDFKENFPQAIAITAKMNYTWDIIYFYFYSEERLNFWNFINSLKSKIWQKFFLFQVWARDRIRLSPEAENMYWTCGKQLCCKTWNCPLPSVESESIEQQSLWYMNNEKLKWRCWKLKCCLNYEKELYEEENKKFPQRWETIQHNEEELNCSSFNIMTWEIVAKNNNNETKRISLNDLK